MGDELKPLLDKIGIILPLCEKSGARIHLTATELKILLERIGVLEKELKELKRPFVPRRKNSNTTGAKHD
jgi:hypothetical protein